MTPRIGSLFTGYGGLDMAVEALTGGTVAWYSEIEKAACTVLASHYPNVPNLGDIKTVDWSAVEPVDILTGGYPCQPFSAAGLRKGTEDERHLWPYVREAMRHLRPALVILENVRGHLSLGIDVVLGEMATVGYDATWGLVRASDAGAPHQRARVFIVAYPHGAGLQGHRSAASEASAERHGHAESSLGALAPDADRDGHGQPLHTRAMGRLEGNAAGEASEWQRPRGLADAGSAGHAPDADADSASSEARRDAGSDSERLRVEPVGSADVAWGKYEPAIRRWEAVTRPAPAPTILGKADRPRLNPAFVEWMMGLPQGHVTGHGLRPSQELKMLGNGVVPQQAFLAIQHLLAQANALPFAEEGAA